MNAPIHTIQGAQIAAQNTAQQADIRSVLEQICAELAQREAALDEQGMFAQDNYTLLKTNHFFSCGIPTEQGGGGLSYPELCAVIQRLGQACSSTALACAMHSHPLALNVYKAKKGDERAIATLQKLAGNELVIAGTGANDWLESNGTATAVEGGYIINAHKRFVSGGPGAQVLVSSVHFQSDNGNEVLHFSLPFATAGIRILDNWNTLGMRATGSNDVILENVFLPESAITARRPAGEWHLLWDLVLPHAMPLICSAYMGIAKSAVELALQASAGRAELAPLVGAMNNHFTMAQLALQDMIALQQDYGFTPSPENTSAVLTRKTLVQQGIHNTVEAAANLCGGQGFFRGHKMERIIRDVRALHFHPLPSHKQEMMSGRILLGLNPVQR